MLKLHMKNLTDRRCVFLCMCARLRIEVCMYVSACMCVSPNVEIDKCASRVYVSFYVRSCVCVCLSESVNNFHGDNPVCSYVCTHVFL